MSKLVINQETYPAVLQEIVPAARKLLWIVTADLKDLHVGAGRKFVPFLQVLAEKIREGVEVRLVHAKEPGPRFRADFERMNAALKERAEGRTEPRSASSRAR